MIRKQQWCIEQIAGETNYRCAKILKIGAGKKKKISFGEVVETQEIKGVCKGNLHLSFSSEEYYLFSDTFPKLKPDLLALQINKRFKDLGLTMDTIQYSHRAQPTPGRQGHLSCLFLMQNELESHFAAVASCTGVSQARLLPSAAAIAGLLGAVTDEPVLVLHIGTRFSHVLIVRNSTPLYSQSLPQTGPGLVDETLIPNAVDFARLSAKKDHDINELLITTFGEAKDNIDLQQLGIEEWHPDFSPVLECSDPDAPRNYPQLFGAVYGDSSFDFLPPEFGWTWKLQSISKGVATLAALGIIGCAAMWYYLQPVLADKQLQYNNLLNAIAKKKELLLNRMPAGAALDNFDRTVNIRSRSAGDFRLDDLVQDLARALPQKVRVTDLQVRREAEEQATDLQPPDLAEFYDDLDGPQMEERGPLLSIAEQLQTKNITIALTCTSDGNYAEVTTRFEKAARSLNKFFGVADLTWNYQETEMAGQLQCELHPLAKGGQP